MMLLNIESTFNNTNKGILKILKQKVGFYVMSADNCIFKKINKGDLA